MLRILILLTVVMAFAAIWEFSKNQWLSPVTGTVIEVRKVISGGKGDSREFVIEYLFNGERYVLVTRRGIIDSLGSFCCLTVGDPVPLATDRTEPSRAILDSLNARYPVTLMIGMLTLTFLLAMLMVAARSRVRNSAT